MADNAQKTPLARNLNVIGQKKVLDQIQLQGKSLPCSVVSVSGSIVTIAFEVTTDFTLPKVTIPVFGPEYIRYPIQVGDKGIVIPADVLLGGINGLGSGNPELSMAANLSALVFMPIGSSDFSATDDPNAIVSYGPNGWVIRDTGKNCSITGDTANVVIKAKTKMTMVCGSATIVLDSNGTITINGIIWGTHEHTGVATGAAKTGGPTAP